MKIPQEQFFLEKVVDMLIEMQRRVPKTHRATKRSVPKLVKLDRYHTIKFPFTTESAKKKIEEINTLIRPGGRGRDPELHQRRASAVDDSAESDALGQNALTAANPTPNKRMEMVKQAQQIMDAHENSPPKLDESESIQLNSFMTRILESSLTAEFSTVLGTARAEVAVPHRGRGCVSRDAEPVTMVVKAK